ncbi:M60 family metallopeptidase [Niabella beijingensis]|uniref:M60 family metallopeptidase n=1 Tax=Niabella beijingensis TaxID=2872700 RepID=UPI001CC04244|nr:M60 family metallopeptidase [Niabella beijingensis]MBZ4191443.1 M60 family metallopeptidase [Niabella beijingensis]
MKHVLKISIAAALLIACNKTPVTSLAGARSQVPHGPGLEMLAQNIWQLTQRSSGQAEASRMMLSLRTADHDPVGLRKNANTPLIVNVTIISGNALPQLLVGSYDRETVTSYNLQPGTNTISGAAGDLYLKFAADQPSAGNKVKVEFVSGFSVLPFYILGTTTNQQWKTMLAGDTLPNVVLVSKRAFVVCSRTKAIEFQDKNQDSALLYIDSALNAEHAFSGLDGSTAADKTWEGKIMIVERTGGYMDATHEGRVRVVGSSFSRVLDHTVITGNGWGLFHEMGHHHQMWNWTFGAVGEVNPNIYTLAAYRKIKSGYTWLTGSKWTAVQQYLALPDSSRNYTTSQASGDVRLALYQQLWLAFGDNFYHNLHQLVRAEKPSPAGNAEEEMRVLMLYASRASGKDLGSFFRKWGFKVSQSVYDEITNLSLPAPSVDITTLHE